MNTITRKTIALPKIRAFSSFKRIHLLRIHVINMNALLMEFKIIQTWWKTVCQFLKYTLTMWPSYLFFFFFLWLHLWHMEVPWLGVKSEMQLYQIHTASVTYTATCSNSLTHWARPGIEPASSWILVRFLTHWATTGTPYQALFVFPEPH